MKCKCLVLVMVFFAQTALAENIVLYSVRSTEKMKTLLQEFQSESGISVTLVGGTHVELTEKLLNNSTQPKADLFLTKDIIYLNEAAELGIFAPMLSEQVSKNIPAYFRHHENLYTLLSYRARIAMVHKDKAHQIRNYEDIGAVEWRKRLCLRNGENSYNLGLISSFLHHYGEERTKNMLGSWLENLAVAPIDGDTKVLEAIKAGVCDVGVVNTYYLAALLAKDPEFPVVPVFLNQGSTGAFVNGYGIGLVKGSQKSVFAAKLVEFLTSKLVQEKFTAPHFEYPANPEALPVPIVQAFGSFIIDQTNISETGKYSAGALKLVREIGYK